MQHLPTRKAVENKEQTLPREYSVAKVTGLVILNVDKIERNKPKIKQQAKPTIRSFNVREQQMNGFSSIPAVFAAKESAISSPDEF